MEHVIKDNLIAVATRADDVFLLGRVIHSSGPELAHGHVLTIQIEIVPQLISLFAND